MEATTTIKMDHYKESEEQRQMRRVCIFACVISTAAVIGAIVTLPMLYSFVQNLQSHLAVETEFCQLRSKDMWVEMSNLQSNSRSERAKRQYTNNPTGTPSYGAPVVAPDTGCCACQQGPPGVPGPKGKANY
ncbi:Cuticle collagen 36 [Aphelenchoides besseyi]|nr:Cuticle collagen 36 [Aphelenchoides besseyi]